MLSINASLMSTDSIFTCCEEGVYGINLLMKSKHLPEIDY